MHISAASQYAIAACIELAQHNGNSPLPSHVIAKARRIPERFLLKVLKPLVGAGLLRSVKGPHGGYRLGRPASKVTLLEVIERIDQPLGSGSDITDQRLDEAFRGAVGLVRRHYGKVTLSQLAKK